MVPYGPVWFCRVLFGLLWSYLRYQTITRASIRKLEKNKKALNSNIYHDITKDDTRYLMLDIMLYHKIAIDNSFCNKLYPCTPIVRLVIFIFRRGSESNS